MIGQWQQQSRGSCERQPSVATPLPPPPSVYKMTLNFSSNDFREKCCFIHRKYLKSISEFYTYEVRSQFYGPLEAVTRGLGFFKKHTQREKITLSEGANGGPTCKPFL